MWIIFCSTKDIVGLWAYHGLLARSRLFKKPVPVELFTTETLANSLRWQQRISANGARDSQLTIDFGDGRRIDSAQVEGVLNRIIIIPAAHTTRMSISDREYTMQELHAFYLGWLYGIQGPVFNRPTPQGLAGCWRPASEWVYLAAQAGLPTPDYRQSSADMMTEADIARPLFPPGTPLLTVFVVGNYVIGAAVPHAIAASCVNLARLANTGLLAIQFMRDTPGSWIFAGADPTPDLRLGGAAVLDAIAAAFQSPEENAR